VSTRRRSRLIRQAQVLLRAWSKTVFERFARLHILVNIHVSGRSIRDVVMPDRWQPTHAAVDAPVNNKRALSFKPAPPAPDVATDAPPRATFDLAMMFVLLTYGGWNEAAYISGEVRNARRNMIWSLLWGISLIAIILVLANLAYLKGLGLTAMSGSEVVAVDVMRRIAGEAGGTFVSALIAIAALGSMNVTTFTGARSIYALG
jgi:hypothetical protein